MSGPRRSWHGERTRHAGPSSSRGTIVLSSSRMIRSRPWRRRKIVTSADDDGSAPGRVGSVMRTWTATTTVDAPPEAVLDVLTDPGACVRWAPVDFEVSDLNAKRLAAGLPPARERSARRRGGGLRRRGPRGRRRTASQLARPDRSRSTSATTSSPPTAAARSGRPSASRPGRGFRGRILAEATSRAAAAPAPCRRRSTASVAA